MGHPARAALLQLLRGVLFLLALSIGARPAFAAFAVPPNTGHVTDTAGKLTASQRLALDEKLDAYRRCSTNEVAVLVTGSLAGESVEDVAYTTFRAWKLGVAGKDNGVLLVIATSERKIRIETGKGVGGELTDLQTSRIISDHIKPHLKKDDTFAAIDDGTTQIASALGTSCVMAPLDPAHGGSKGDTRIFLILYGSVVGSLTFLVLLILGLFADHRIMPPLVFSALLVPVITLVVSSLTPSWGPAFAAAHVSFLGIFLAMYRHERAKHRGPAEGMLRGRSGGGSGESQWAASSGYVAPVVYNSSSSSSDSTSSYGGDSGGSSFGGSDFSGGGGDTGGGGSSDSY